MKNIILILKGFLVGIAKVIPGVSGALLAVSLGIYDRGIKAIVEFFTNKKENFKFLFFVCLGVITSILLTSKFIIYLLDNYYKITMFLFILLIAFGIKDVYKLIDKSKRGIFITLFSFIFIMFLSISGINNNYIIKNNSFDYFMYFLSGIFDAFGTVVPGISSTALLMMLGTYNIIINSLASLMDINIIYTNISILIPYSMGMLVGLIFTSILINYLLKRYKSKTYSMILGIVIASILLLIIKTI